MAKTIKSIGAMLLLMAFLLSLSACGGGNITGGNEDHSLVVLETVAKGGTKETPEPKPVLYIYHTH